MIVPSTQKEPELFPEVKPSMARAPKLKKRIPVEHTPGGTAGVKYEVYSPAKHGGMQRSR